MSWKDHITGLTSKLNKACYAIRAIKPFTSLDVMKMINYSYVHSVISYGIIFWGNSHLSDSIFEIKKIIIRVITNSGRHDSCSDLYKKITNIATSLPVYLLITCFCQQEQKLHYI